MRAWFVFSSIALLALAGCGQPVCIFDLGDCAAYDRTISNTSTSTTSLSVSGPSTISLATPSQTFTPSGGLSPYSFAIASTSPTANCGSFSPNASVTGTTTFTAVTVGTCQIQVSDASSPANTSTKTLSITY